MKTKPERRDDAAFMERSLLWPRWPVLPLKRYVDDKMECAFMLEGAGFTLFLGNMYQLTEKKPLDFEQKRYATTAEIVADGWMVD